MRLEAKLHFPFAVLKELMRLFLNPGPVEEDAHLVDHDHLQESMLEPRVLPPHRRKDSPREVLGADAPPLPEIPPV